MDPIVSVMVQPSRQAELGMSGQTSSYTVTRTLPEREAAVGLDSVESSARRVEV